MRIKNQEVLDKEEQIRALLAANRNKLDHLLSLRGKGNRPCPFLLPHLLSAVLHVGSIVAIALLSESKVAPDQSTCGRRHAILVCWQSQLV